MSLAPGPLPTYAVVGRMVCYTAQGALVSPFSRAWVAASEEAAVAAAERELLRQQDVDLFALGARRI